MAYKPILPQVYRGKRGGYSLKSPTPTPQTVILKGDIFYAQEYVSRPFETFQNWEQFLK